MPNDVETGNFIMTPSRAMLARDIMVTDRIFIDNFRETKNLFLAEETDRHEIEQLLDARDAKISEIILRTLVLWKRDLKDEATFKKCLDILKQRDLHSTFEKMYGAKDKIWLGHDRVRLVKGNWLSSNGSSLTDLDGESTLPSYVLEDEELSDILPESCITRHWIVTKQARNEHEIYYSVKDHPIAPGKDGSNYAPSRSQDRVTQDCMIISQVCRDRCSLGLVLKSFIDKGLSANFLVPQEDITIQWIDPKLGKPQIAGKWNSRSVGILVVTDENQNVSSSQIARIKQIYETNSPSVAYKIRIEYLGSHQEAQGSGYEGRVTNVQTIRDTLGLKRLPSFPN